MIALILYLIAIFALMIFLIFMIVYTILLIYSSWMGSPYVPTKQKELEFILSQIKLSKNKLFLELGCGDGRVVRTASSIYKVKGIGVDINPMIIKWAIIISKFQKLKSLQFKVENILNTDVSKADYIYLFLLPNLIKKLSNRLLTDMKPNSFVISHGFVIEGWTKLLIKKIPHTPFPTYIYQLPTS